ncbi:MAG: Excinuclease ABC, C subunit [uncultured bacterium]|nr:MAG: Excinuclease ABC, C subunit [uncultured bacterium]HBR71447.1 endonuclease [Candidatus Moranbacteria bacterium]
MFFIYVIKNEQSGKIYIGQTNDIEKRLQRHNGILKSKNTSYTYKNKGEWKVVYTEEFKSRSEAIKREKELKSYQGREFLRSKIDN